MQLCQFARDGQSDAGTADSFGEVGAEAFKGLEDGTALAGGDARAAILHDDARVAFVMLRADADPLARIGVFIHVGNEIAEDLLDGVRIGHDGLRAVQGGRDLKAFVLKQRLPEFGNARHGLIQRERLGLNGELVTLLAGVVEDVLDQAVQTAGFSLHHTELAFRDGIPLRLRTMSGHFGIEADVGQWRLQLMRDLIDERHALLRHPDFTGALVEIEPADHKHEHNAGTDTEQDRKEVGLWKFLIRGCVSHLPL